MNMSVIDFARSDSGQTRKSHRSPNLVEIPAAFRRDMIDRDVWAAALAIVKR